MFSIVKLISESKNISFLLLWTWLKPHWLFLVDQDLIIVQRQWRIGKYQCWLKDSSFFKTRITCSFHAAQAGLNGLILAAEPNAVMIFEPAQRKTKTEKQSKISKTAGMISFFFCFRKNFSLPCDKCVEEKSNDLCKVFERSGYCVRSEMRTFMKTNCSSSCCVFTGNLTFQ